MGISLRINDYRNGIAGASGVVTLSFGPVPPWCVWQVDQLSISLSRGTGKCTVTHGPTTSAPIAIDATALAQGNQDAPANWRLWPGESITVQFVLLQNGVTATATLRGTQEPYP